MRIQTVPTSKPSPRDSTWNVRRSGFPFNEPGPVIGTVQAPDRHTAVSRALEQFGADAVVESRPQSSAKSPGGQR